MDGISDAPAGKATFGLATDSDEFEFYVLSMAISAPSIAQFQIFHPLARFYGYLKLCATPRLPIFPPQPFNFMVMCSKISIFIAMGISLTKLCS
jgi:hypothetical protein